MDIAKLIQLKPDEEVLMTVRQDFVPFVPRMVFFALWFVIPFFFLFPLFRQGAWGVGVFLLLVLSAVFFSLRSWFAWQRTIFVVTDRRLIDIDQHGFFDRSISELFFSGIDEVSFRRKGFFSTIFRYGLVLIKTTGSAADIEVRRVRNPSRLTDLVNDLREAVINEEPKDPKTRKVRKLVKGMSEDEIEELAEVSREKFRKRAVREFFEEDEE